MAIESVNTLVWEEVKEHGKRRVQQAGRDYLHMDCQVCEMGCGTDGDEVWEDVRQDVLKGTIRDMCSRRGEDTPPLFIGVLGRR